MRADKALYCRNACMIHVKHGLNVACSLRAEQAHFHMRDGTTAQIMICSHCQILGFEMIGIYSGVLAQVTHSGKTEFTFNINVHSRVFIFKLRSVTHLCQVLLSHMALHGTPHACFFT